MFPFEVTTAERCAGWSGPSRRRLPKSTFDERASWRMSSGYSDFGKAGLAYPPPVSIGGAAHGGE